MCTGPHRMLLPDGSSTVLTATSPRAGPGGDRAALQAASNSGAVIEKPMGTIVPATAVCPLSIAVATGSGRSYHTHAGRLVLANTRKESA